MEPFRLIWAKHGKSAVPTHHPLICHLLDVAAVCLCLWERVLKEKTTRRFASALGLEPEVAKQWLAFWVGAHDLGKASPGFQRKSPEIEKLLTGLGLSFPAKGAAIPHGTVTAHVLRDLLTGPTDWRAIPRELASRIATAVGGHHGVFPRASETIRLASRELGNGDWSAIRQKVLACLANALQIDDLPAPHGPTENHHPFFMGLAGLTSVADWIGSAEKYFPYVRADVEIEQHWRIVQSRAETALEDLGWTGWRGDSPTRTFSETFHFEPRPLQQEAIRQAVDLRGPGLVLIEAPMGEGKTEAALFLADHWIHATGQQGLYVALPTQATSNQMFSRVNRFLAHRYPNEKVNFQLLHGHALLSDAYQELRLAAIYDETKPHDSASGRVVAEGWFVPKKRGLLAPFGVGTIDQALLAVLQTKHMFVRLFGLTNKVVVFDEVHAYDAYMYTLLERLLQWLSALGCSVVLLSATLPKAVRQRLLAAFSGSSVERDEPAYPRMLTICNGRTTAASLGVSRTAEIQVRWIDASRLAADLGSALGEGGCGAVICNTVGRAQQTYRTLRDALPAEEFEVMLFHARFPRGQRDEIEKQVIARFGKDGDRPNRAVLVATQVIEQSLDLDFDLMVTEMAPADLVLQRAGWLHRHDRKRPSDRLKNPQLWIIQPEVRADGLADFGSSEHVYDWHILLRSYLALKGRATIGVPRDIETLIETVYGDLPLEVPNERWRARLDQTKKELDTNRWEQEQIAKRYCIKRPDHQDDVLQDFCQELEEDNPEVHRNLQALTRLGDPTVDVVCLYQSDVGLFLDPDRIHAVDPKEEPTPQEARQLLLHSVGLSHYACVNHFFDQEAPSGWRRSAPLRHHRVAILDAQHEMRVAQFTLRIDPELGAVVQKAEG